MINTRIYFFLLLFLISTSCAELRYLDLAQNAFSEGATLENQGRWALTSTEALPSNNQLSDLSPEYYYNQAYSDVRKALKQEAKLKNEGLLANALLLQALCEWKLGQYVPASLSAQKAKVALEASGLQMPRDKALLIAFDGLIGVEQAFYAQEDLSNQVKKKLLTPLTSTTTNEFFQEIKRHYERHISSPNSDAKIAKGLVTIDRAKESVSATHNVQRYLLLSQLAGLKTWLDELNTIDQFLRRSGLGAQDRTTKQWLDGELDQYAKRKELYLNQLATSLENAKENSVYQAWDLLLSV